MIASLLRLTSQPGMWGGALIYCNEIDEKRHRLADSHRRLVAEMGSATYDPHRVVNTDDDHGSVRTPRHFTLWEAIDVL